MHLSETDHHRSKGLFTASLQADVKSMVERYGHTTAPILCKFLGKKKKKFEGRLRVLDMVTEFLCTWKILDTRQNLFFLNLSSTSLSVWIIFVNC